MTSKIHVHIIDEEVSAIGITMVMALIHADKTFDEFANEFQLPESERKTMQDELREIITTGMFAETDSLKVLLSIWGKDKTFDYVETLTGRKMPGRE